MNLQLISLQTTDNLLLPGLLYSPDKPGDRVLIWLHGMGDSGIFYSQERIKALASALTNRGIALLAFNNRGAHNVKLLGRVSDDPDDDGPYLAGTHYERIADCVADIDGAVAWAAAHGFSRFYLAGHSTGANKICVYNQLAAANPFEKYVLAGPGDDCGLFFSELGEEKFRTALSYAKRAVADGKGENVMPRYSGMHPFSAQAALDILDPDGNYNTFPLYEATTKRLGSKPLFKEYSAIKLPLLVIYGEHDEYTYTGGGTASSLAIFRSYTNNETVAKSEFVMTPETDHSFHGREVTFAETVATWIQV